MSFASEFWKRREVAQVPATSMVKKATGDFLTEPDWAVNMNVCDLVNSGVRQARDVVKAVKKRITHRRPMVQFLALTLLETVIKNCAEYVRLQVVECGVLIEMVKIVKKKPDNRVRDKILILLDAWQEAFGGPHGKYPQYFWAYEKLKESGIKFPTRSGDTAPIFTPPITKPSFRNPPQRQRDNTSSLRLDEVIASENEIFSMHDFHSIRSAMELLTDMLESVNINNFEALQDDVITDLVKQCFSNQKAVMHLIDSTRNEELLIQALALNDNLQNVIFKYNALANGQPVTHAKSQTIGTQNSVPADSSLQVDEEDDEDGFTQLARRNSSIYQHTSVSSMSSGKGFTETSSNLKDVTGESIINVPSPLSLIPSTAIQRGENISTPLSTFSFGQSYPTLKPFAHPVPIIPPISYASQLSPSENSYFTSLMVSSPEVPPPLNPLALSESLQSNPNPPVNYVTGTCNLQPHPMNQGYIPYKSYIASWAHRSQPQSTYEQEASQSFTSYPPPPWETSDDELSSDPSQISSTFFPREELIIKSELVQNLTCTVTGTPSTALPAPYENADIRNADEGKQSAAITSMRDILGHRQIDSPAPRP